MADSNFAKHAKHVFDDLDKLSHAVVLRWIELAAKAIVTHGAFYVALSGGSTPKRLYQLLATPEYARQIDWDKVHIYFTDERGVPNDHKESNYRMVRDSLLHHIPIPPLQVHLMDAQPPRTQQGARHYHQLLTTQLPASAQQIPLFDLVLLGMGKDGHTASLFSGSEALKQDKQWAVAVHVDKLNSWRITLTYPVLNQARQIFVLVTGADKEDMVHHVLGGERHLPLYPIQRIKPKGEMVWYLDAAAARLLI